MAPFFSASCLSNKQLPVTYIFNYKHILKILKASLSLGNLFLQLSVLGPAADKLSSTIDCSL